MYAKWDSFHMLHHDLAGGAFKKEQCSCYPEHVCVFTSACVHAHLFALCCALLATSGNGRCHPGGLLHVKFYEGFCKCELAVAAVSSPLLQSLTPASKVSPTEFSIYCCRIVYLGS